MDFVRFISAVFCSRDFEELTGDFTFDPIEFLFMQGTSPLSSMTSIIISGVRFSNKIMSSALANSFALCVNVELVITAPL